jgi:archaellum biogenesis protein FlaJ (TadC family)
MFKDGPKHYRAFYLSAVWVLAMVLVVMVLQLTGQTMAANIAFSIGAAGSVLGLVVTAMYYRLSKRERRPK